MENSGNKVVLAATNILFSEKEDDDMLLLLLNSDRKKTSDLFRKRSEQGYFNLLINQHLLNNEEMFRQFFRLNKSQFYFVLGIIQESLTKFGTPAVKYPISPEEKLGLTLR